MFVVLIYIVVRLCLIYMTHTVFYTLGRVSAPQHVTVFPDTCDNLTLPGGPRCSDSVRNQSTPTLAVTFLGVVQKRDHTTYTPQYILALVQFQNGSLTSHPQLRRGSLHPRDVRQPHIHTHT